MPFWRRNSLPKEGEIELGHAAAVPPPALAAFEVIIEPSPPFHIRVRNSIRTWYTSLTPADKKVCAAITLDAICIVYQTIDAYATLYPGSKIAANILLNANTNRAWEAFFWLFAIFTSLANVIAAPIWVAWCARKLQIDRLRVRKCCFCLVVSLCVGIIVPALAAAPFWATWVIRVIWQDIAWSRVCNGWEVDAVLTGVDWQTYYPNITSVGGAVVVIGRGEYTMQLFRDAVLHNLFTFNVTNTLNFTPPLSTISYDMDALTYTVANVTTSFNMTPNLSFPSLNVQLADPSIPFVRTDPSYPPSANLIYRNGTSDFNFLRTELLDYPDCTQLKVCGMQDSTRRFQITLGVVMIEQFSAAVFCTIPSSGG